nr:MAG TPA: major capsid protein [Caudoviricetes sp.]DAX25830.1 MAG TPA: major capsid protein [Caudoviricetes sp.]
MAVKCDFSGYATKNDVRCSDNKVIRHGAFAAYDGKSVPLVWQHQHKDVTNVLGHADLEVREDGVYAYAHLNHSDAGRTAREMVRNGDIKAMSIYATHVKARGNDVVHGELVEVSLVLRGANPGAYIDQVSIQHGDNGDEIEAVMYTDAQIDFVSHSDEEDEDFEAEETYDVEHAEEEPEANEAESDEDDPTLGEIFEGMTDQQKTAVYAIVGQIVDADDEEAEEPVEDTAHSDTTTEDTMAHQNVFEGSKTEELPVLTHADVEQIFADAKSCGSLKEAVLSHADNYGIKQIDTLFPDAKNLWTTPEFIKRKTDWVSSVVGAAKHSPFSRIKTQFADITADEARAKGYIKGNKKKDEVFSLLKRTTSPTTIYKKQKLDRDDILDITDFDVVTWIRGEMRIMIEEELGRAVLLGDGREASSDDKIKEDCIRPVYKEDTLYAPRVILAKETTTEDMLDSIVRAMDDYEGSGNPTWFAAPQVITEILLLKDKMGHRLFSSLSDLADYVGVSKIVKVPLMKNLVRTSNKNGKVDALGIIVNMSDYTIGADKGGQLFAAEDFDISFNQYHYLLETRLSGALTKVKSAIILERKQEAGSPVAED